MPVESSSATTPVRTRANLSLGVSPAGAWTNVVLAAMLMLATLPGRTQGLGLVTEKLLADLRLDRVAYAEINLWATLLGSLACLPAGWLIDRFGLRWTAFGIVGLLAGVVWLLNAFAGGVTLLFMLILLTRALGQSALSVVSITAVGKSFGSRAGWAMGVYAVLLSVLFATAFVLIGQVVEAHGWRTAWRQVAIGLLIIAPLAGIFLREPGRHAESPEARPDGFTFGAALRMPLFWIFAGATALFGLVSSGLGLFNEAVLAERGFDAKAYHQFLAVTTLFALVGQIVCGWFSRTRSMPRLLALALFLYAAGLGALPSLQTQLHLWIFAGVFGVAAGFITVIFFAIWGQAFGHRQLGRIQGAAQMLTVFASAVGPLLFAKSHAVAGSYAPLLYGLAPVVLAMGIAAWWTKLPSASSSPLPS